MKKDRNSLVDSYGNYISDANVFGLHTASIVEQCDEFHEEYTDGEVSYKDYEAALDVRSDLEACLIALISDYTYCKVGNETPCRTEYGDAILMDKIVSEGRSLIMSDPTSDEIRKFKSKVLKIEKDFARYKEASSRYNEANEKAERFNSRFDTVVEKMKATIHKGDYDGFISLVDQVIPDKNIKVSLKVEAVRAKAKEKAIFTAEKAKMKANNDRKVIIQEAIKETSMYLLGAALPILARGIIRKK